MQTLWDLIVHEFTGPKVGCEKLTMGIVVVGVAYWLLRRHFKKFQATRPE